MMLSEFDTNKSTGSALYKMMCTNAPKMCRVEYRQLDKLSILSRRVSCFWYANLTYGAYGWASCLPGIQTQEIHAHHCYFPQNAPNQIKWVVKLCRNCSRWLAAVWYLPRQRRLESTRVRRYIILTPDQPGDPRLQTPDSVEKTRSSCFYLQLRPCTAFFLAVATCTSEQNGQRIRRRKWQRKGCQL